MFKKRISIFACIVISLLLCTGVFVATYSGMQIKQKEEQNLSAENSIAEENENGYKKIEDILSRIDKTYLKDYDRNMLWEYIYKALVLGLGDQHSCYMTKEEFDSLMSTESGSFVGIGVHASYDVDEIGAYLSDIMADSPAEKAGLIAGDVIKAVNGREITEENYIECIDDIKGVEGSEVTLDILRNGERFSKVLTRKYVKSQNIVCQKIDSDTALVRILTFADTTVAEEFKSKVNKVLSEGCTKLIFDVRNNGGGFLNEICDILDFLLPEGVLINIVDKDGNITQQTSGPGHIDADMYVLCNENTASAAELFTKALMDFNYAKSIGKTTYGKGTMQTTVTLPDGSALKLSTHYYNPPCNISYDGVGIKPDFDVSLDEKWETRFFKMPISEDAQLQKALSLIREGKN